MGQSLVGMMTEVGIALASAGSYDIVPCDSYGLLANLTTTSFTVRTPGTYKNLSVDIYTNTIGSGISSTFTLYNSGSPTSVAVSVAGAATGSFCDPTDGAVFSSGNTIYVLAAIGTSAGHSMSCRGVKLCFNMPGSACCTRVANGLNSTTVSPSGIGTFYFPIMGVTNAASTALVEFVSQFNILTTATLANLIVIVTANSKSGTTTVNSRVNSNNGNMAVSIPGGATGVFEDLTDTDSVGFGSLVDYSVTTSSTGTITFAGGGLDILTVNNSFHVGSMYSLGTSGTGYSALLGDARPTATLAVVNYPILINTPFIASMLSLSVIVSETYAMSTYINGSSGNQTVSGTASVNGWVTDTTHQDWILPGSVSGTTLTGNPICYAPINVTGGSGLSMLMTNVGTLAATGVG